MTYIKNRKLKNYVHNVDTSFTSQALTATSKSDSTAFNSTEVIYTPHSDALKVVYEISFQIAWNPDTNHNMFSFRLEYSADNGSSWTDLLGTQGFVGTQGSSSEESAWSIHTYRCILDTWSGERKIRANGPCWSLNSQYTLGRSYNANDSTGVGSCPHVSIYSML